MDSTLISTRPGGTLANRARRAAFGSFAGPSDWYDFCSTASPPLWCLTANSFRKLAPPWARSPRLPPLASASCSARWAGDLRPLWRPPCRKRMLMLTVWMMGIATALIGILPSFATIGWWAPVLLVTLRAIQGFAVGGEWGGAALLSVESAPKIRKRSTAAACRLGTAWVCCSLPGWCRLSATSRPMSSF